MPIHISEIFATRGNESALLVLSDIVFCCYKPFKNHFASLLLLFTIRPSHTLCFSASRYLSSHPKMATQNGKKKYYFHFLTKTVPRKFMGVFRVLKMNREVPGYTNLCIFIHSMIENDFPCRNQLQKLERNGIFRNYQHCRKMRFDHGGLETVTSA